MRETQGLKGDTVKGTRKRKKDRVKQMRVKRVGRARGNREVVNNRIKQRAIMYKEPEKTEGTEVKVDLLCQDGNGLKWRQQGAQTGINFQSDLKCDASNQACWENQACA